MEIRVSARTVGEIAQPPSQRKVAADLCLDH